MVGAGCPNPALAFWIRPLGQGGDDGSLRSYPRPSQLHKTTRFPMASCQEVLQARNNPHSETGHPRYVHSLAETPCRFDPRGYFRMASSRSLSHWLKPDRKRSLFPL